MPDLRHQDYALRVALLTASLLATFRPAHAQGTIPTFTRAIGGSSYTLAGRDPAQHGATVIPTVLVPITLTFDGKTIRMDAAPDVPPILTSPVFSNFALSSGKKTQYADALLRSTFPKDKRDTRCSANRSVKPITIAIPAGYGYLLTSKKSGTSFGVVDSEFLQKQLFQQIPRQDGALVVAVTHNTTYYADCRRNRMLRLGNTRHRRRHRQLLRAWFVISATRPPSWQTRISSRSPSSSRSSSTIRCTIR